jgi:hypothetical protein
LRYLKLCDRARHNNDICRSDPAGGKALCGVSKTQRRTRKEGREVNCGATPRPRPWSRPWPTHAAAAGPLPPPAGGASPPALCVGETLGLSIVARPCAAICVWQSAADGGEVCVVGAPPIQGDAVIVCADEIGGSQGAGGRGGGGARTRGSAQPVGLSGVRVRPAEEERLLVTQCTLCDVSKTDGLAMMRG